MLDHYHSDIWWERRHAIETTWRLFTHTDPCDGLDLPNVTLWNAIRVHLLGERNEVIALLQSKTADPDEDVRASAVFALGKIMEKHL